MNAKIHAHRGLHSQHTENTLPAFQAAIAAGADGIELDVVLTKDHELLVLHDPYIWVDGKLKAIYKHTLQDIRTWQLDFYPPTLQEVFQAFADSPQAFVYNIELKYDNFFTPYFYPASAKKYACMVEDFLAKHLPKQKIYVQSFSADLLNELALLIKQPLVLLSHAPVSSALLLQNLQFKPFALSVECQHVQAQEVQTLQKQNIDTWCYTVQEKQQIPALDKSGVAVVICDVW
jgi:glycerophosphoryl diester phosphodiesterase